MAENTSKMTEVFKEYFNKRTVIMWYNSTILYRLLYRYIFMSMYRWTVSAVIRYCYQKSETPSKTRKTVAPPRKCLTTGRSLFSTVLWLNDQCLGMINCTFSQNPALPCNDNIRGGWYWIYMLVLRQGLHSDRSNNMQSIATSKYHVYVWIGTTPSLPNLLQLSTHTRQQSSARVSALFLRKPLPRTEEVDIITLVKNTCCGLHASNMPQCLIHVCPLAVSWGIKDGWVRLTWSMLLNNVWLAIHNMQQEAARSVLTTSCSNFCFSCLQVSHPNDSRTTAKNPTGDSSCLAPRLPAKVLYLNGMPGFAEERRLGREESEVFVLIVQAAVAAAHAVTAGHGRGRLRVDSHGEVWMAQLDKSPAWSWLVSLRVF